jgi:hypothetical protein
VGPAGLGVVPVGWCRRCRRDGCGARRGLGVFRKDWQRGGARSRCSKVMGKTCEATTTGRPALAAVVIRAVMPRRAVQLWFAADAALAFARPAQLKPGTLDGRRASWDLGFGTRGRRVVPSGRVVADFGVAAREVRTVPVGRGRGDCGGDGLRQMGCVATGRVGGEVGAALAVVSAERWWRSPERRPRCGW